MQAQELCEALSSRGVTVNEQMLKVRRIFWYDPLISRTETTQICDLYFQVVLSASHMLSAEDLRRFALGLSPLWDLECDQLLHAAVSKVSERNENQSHVVLILDKVGLLKPVEGGTYYDTVSVCT